MKGKLPGVGRLFVLPGVGQCGMPRLLLPSAPSPEGSQGFPRRSAGGGMSEAPFLFQSLSQANDEVPPPKEPPPSNATSSSSSVTVAGASPPLLSVALGVAAALLLHLR